MAFEKLKYDGSQLVGDDGNGTEAPIKFKQIEVANSTGLDADTLQNLTPSEIGSDPGDDESFTFGAGDDMGIRYDSFQDSLRIRDEQNSADVFEVKRGDGTGNSTGGNVNIKGEITENASL